MLKVTVDVPPQPSGCGPVLVVVLLAVVAAGVGLVLVRRLRNGHR